MKLCEVMQTANDKRIEIIFRAVKKKKNNPKKSKTTKLDSFIDTFGGMAGYPTGMEVGKGFQI